VSPPLLARRALRSRVGHPVHATGQVRLRTEIGSSLDRESAVRTLCLNEPAAAGSTRRSRFREVLAFLLFAALTLTGVARAQTPAGTPIPNTGFATYDVGATIGIVRPSNTLIVTTVAFGTSSSLDFMRYAPGAPGSVTYSVTPTACFDGVAFNPLPPPNAFGGGPIGLGSVELVGTPTYRVGEPVFVRLTDADKNLNPAVIDFVTVNLAAATVGDTEQLQLQETGLNTGVFVGYVPTSAPPAPANDCVLAAPAGQSVTSSYTDPLNAGDTSSDSALIDPESRVFDSTTGGPVNGALVTLIDDGTGLPAVGILGDDGISTFPATVTSGGSVTDGGGATYNFGPGGYRFPIVPAGTYRLQVTPPANYVFPSVVPDPNLQTLPNAPWSLSAGSRGVAFAFAGGIFLVDVPLDSGNASQSFITIRPSREVILVGDHLQFDVRVTNPGSGAAPGGVSVTVNLPPGFKFKPGSVRIDDVKQPDPIVSPDGRTLTWTLPVSALPVVTHIRFTTGVTTGAATGPNRATARADAIGGSRTATAVAIVRVEQELMGTKAYILGRVSKGKCTDSDFGGEPMVGARVYLEDGTYSVTDANGMYHFEGVRPGTHVVQLDIASLPAWFEPLPCPGDEGNLFAGRPFSQFVELAGGTMWRNDFRVQEKPQRQGAVNQRLESQRTGETIHYQLALNGAGVGLRNPRAMVMLPDGVTYLPGSAKSGAAQLADPRIDGNALTFPLGDETLDDWSMEITFDAKASAPRNADLETKSVLLFETPSEKAGKTPVALNLLQGQSSAGSGQQVVETLGLREGQSWKKGDEPEPEPPKPTVYNKEWLATAQPGFEWLSPEPGFAPPIASVHVAIKHAPNTSVELTLNGERVSQFNFEGAFRNAAGTVMLSRWRGVDLIEGDNTFVARELDANGAELDKLEKVIHYAGPPFKVELAPEGSVLVADGVTTPVIAVRLTDEYGKPAREGMVGAFELEAPYQVKLDPSVRELRRQAGLGPETPTYRVGADGVAKIELMPTTVSGKSTLRFQLAGRQRKELHPWLEATAREWVLVGLTGGSLAHANVSDHMEGLSGAPDDGFSLDRGTSFFAKGQIKGSWLLTASYDSQREASESDEQFRRALEGGIDPNQYYTLYGDTSETRFESPSQRPLYLKLERKQFYALFGDYTTGLTTTELGKYNRSLNGLHTEFENEYFTFNAFGTDTSQAFVSDEIRGNGTSGLYQLSRTSIVVNSEKVRLETRDRFHAETLINEQAQARYVDYNIDYQAGTIFFKQPIPSHGEGFNPLFIVVEYEADDSEDTEISGGGRGAVKLFDDRFELGSTVLHEGTVGRTSSLYGGDVRIDLDDSTRFRGEYASTHSALLDPTADDQGGAWLAELVRRDGDLDSRAYYREQRGGFGVGQQSASLASSRKLGVDARYALTDEWRVAGQAFRESDLQSSASRDVFEARAEHSDGPLAFYGGGRYAHDKFSDGADVTAPQLLGGASYMLYGNRLKLRGDTEITVGGSSDQSLEFPTRFLLGADFELLPNLTVFAEEELALADERTVTSTRVGLRTSPWQGSQVSASLGQRGGQDASRLFTTIGALQTFQLTDAWSFDVGVDNSITLKGDDTPAGQISPFGNKQPVAIGLSGDPGGDDFTSISLGTTYAEARWAANLRVETRQGSERDKWGVTAGAFRQFDDGVGMSLRAEFFDMNGGAAAPLGQTPTYSTSFDSSTATTGSSGLSSLYGVQSLGRLRFSAVYRPVGSRFIFLDSTEFRRERLDGDIFGSRSNRIVNNMNLNVKLDRKTQLSFQYGAKYLLEDIDGQNLRGYTDVSGVELRRDLWGGFDVGARAGLRHSYADGTTQQLYSASLGYVVFKNLWVTAGYNFGGYSDRDFSKKDWTSEGPFISFKYKFDQQTVKELLEWGE